MNIFTKFHKDWTTIVDFLLIAKFWATPIFFPHPLDTSLYVLIVHVFKRDSPYLQMLFALADAGKNGPNQLMEQ